MRHPTAVIVATPAHSALGHPLSYWSELPLAPGTLVRVPLGSRQTLGVVWPPEGTGPDPRPDIQDKPVIEAFLALPPLSRAWQQLLTFAAHYYQRSVGEVALAALPPQLREINGAQLARRLARKAEHAQPAQAGAAPQAPALSPQQAQALAALADPAPTPALLFGATGSGKTEVYLRAVEALLARDPQAQALVLVPEINLTPQLQARFASRFAAHLGPQGVVSLHSAMTPPQRLAAWLAAHQGRARIVLGTRMAVLASMPGLGLIVVDEEHDPSYKQQEGARYSARDLAIWRARHEGARVVLGSATPSLESWRAAQVGRYRLLAMPARVGDAQLPQVRVVDMGRQPPRTVFAPPLLAAMTDTLARGQQALVLLNRRGFAPVLACTACDWKSACPHCSAFRVFHKIDRTLRCHHCGHAERVPRACPTCGNLDIAPLGRGTERIEEQLAPLLAGAGPGGAPVRIARIDADSTRGAGQLATQLARVHDGEVDVLVGTQMVAKGHDFRRIGLVAALEPDAQLFSSDFRAPERLFALLMQAAGRAGRAGADGAAPSQMWVQTFHPQHPLFAALKAHDYPAFAAAQLAEREQAGLPPYAHQALLRADARTQEAAQAFLAACAQAGAAAAEAAGVTLYPPVPLPVQRVANVERAQMLVESGSRPALQRFLTGWQPMLHAARARGVLRWAVDVDPLAI